MMDILLIVLVVLGFIFSYCIIGFMFGCLITTYEISHESQNTNLLLSDLNINRKAVKEDIAKFTFFWPFILSFIIIFVIMDIARKIADVTVTLIDKITKPKRVEEKIKRK